MTPTETAACKWLQTQGYELDDITFRYTRTPDFLTADGKRWEVKRLVGRVARFELGQIAVLRQLGPTAVLFWRDGESVPVAIADFAELPMPGWWGDIKTYVIWQPKADIPQPVHTAEAVDALVARCLAEGTRQLPLQRAEAGRNAAKGAS